MEGVFPIEFELSVPKLGFEWRRRAGHREWWLYPVEAEDGGEVPQRTTCPASDSPAFCRELADLAGRMTERDDGREAVAAFATQHGLLGVGETAKSRGRKVQVESLSAWREAVEDLAWSVHTWEVMLFGSLAEMNRELRSYDQARADRVGVNRDGGAVFGNLRFDPGVPSRQYRSKEKAANHLRQIVAAKVTDELSRGGTTGGTARAYPRPIVYRNRVEFRLQPIDLLGFAWLQFGLALDSGSETRTCPRCGNYFVVAISLGTRTTRRFCSDTCKTFAYRRRIDTAREMAAKGRSAKQIAAALSEDTARPVSIKAVRRWIAKS